MFGMNRCGCQGLVHPQCGEEVSLSPITSKKEWYARAAGFNGPRVHASRGFRPRPGHVYCVRSMLAAGAPFICYGAAVFPRSIPVGHQITEKADDSAIIIQGEIGDTPLGISIEVTTIQDAMRFALLCERYTISRVSLRAILGWEVYSWLLDLLMPEHVIEFSWYASGQGVYGERVIIWEIRRY